MSAYSLHTRRVPPGPASRPRGARAPRPVPIRRFGPAAALGNEPPLDLDAPTVSSHRHALSVRWLGASVLTALAGFLLIGSAIVVSQRGDTDVIEAPETEGLAQPRRAEAGDALKKGDKLVRTETVASAKQTFRAPMTIRSGEREVIRMRSFTRVATALPMTTGVYATSIPAFNPMRFMSGQDNERALEPPPETADAEEVSIVKTDLATLVQDPSGPTLGDQDAAAQVAAELRAGAARQGGPGLLALPTPSFLPRAVGAGPPSLVPSLSPRPGDGAFRSIEVRVVPENVTNLPKPGERSAEAAFEDRVVPLKRGDTLEAVLRANGAPPGDARTMTALLGRDRPLDGLQLRLLLAPREKQGDPRTIVRALLYGERGIEAIAAMNDRRAFVSVAPPVEERRADQRGPASKSGDESDDEDEGTGPQLFASVYEAAAKHDIPRPVVEELVRVMGYDVDFQRRVQQGDSLELVLGSDDEAGDRQELLEAVLTTGGETRRVFRYQGEDGTVDYFDEEGRSLKKFLLRKPILEARLTSGFGFRIHPILGYARGHKGVDWANKIGTPIFAAGNGTIIKADWASGYGRRTEIQHANGYVTTYNHQSAFARGIAPGVRVRQGQVIGYVGTTGLSTGPHLHYEVIVNGTYVDPMKIRVPRGRELDGRSLAEFNRQRDQIMAIAKRGATVSQVAASPPGG
ncbi:M23 family metallopeptidase [Enterovirga sp.]|uniref:M23 family metallopeptidase n=1 Tax=Enterovirga sp. TaxID=2026350 RepID=UPI002BDC0055|nr:M23 family metallopeptidase [Enterovirga sp.]HMO30994.1 M23 family metallopeptidase [Enterovirga sp.]